MHDNTFYRLSFCTTLFMLVGQLRRKAYYLKYCAR